MASPADNPSPSPQPKTRTKKGKKKTPRTTTPQKSHPRTATKQHVPRTHHKSQSSQVTIADHDANPVARAEAEVVELARRFREELVLLEQEKEMYPDGILSGGGSWYREQQRAGRPLRGRLPRLVGAGGNVTVYRLEDVVGQRERGRVVVDERKREMSGSSVVESRRGRSVGMLSLSWSSSSSGWSDGDEEDEVEMVAPVVDQEDDVGVFRSSRSPSNDGISDQGRSTGHEDEDSAPLDSRDKISGEHHCHYRVSHGGRDEGADCDTAQHGVHAEPYHDPDSEESDDEAMDFGFPWP